MNPHCRQCGPVESRKNKPGICQGCWTTSHGHKYMTRSMAVREAKILAKRRRRGLTMLGLMSYKPWDIMHI